MGDRFANHELLNANPISTMWGNPNRTKTDP